MVKEKKGKGVIKNDDTMLSIIRLSKWFGVLEESYYLIINNILLFLGVGFMSFSLLSFKHGRYCDGTPTDHYSCLNSATFYEYTPGIIFLFVIGALLVSYWYIKRTTTVYYGE
ncbi:MAG: hypothetical protein KAS07_05315 [Candidatus Pacebacteria bacterium]|nr:hypothetical protein [Candidatus Paceibacterota bacterium]